jgi:hypothetical protein
MVESDYTSPDGTLRFLVRSANSDISMGFEGFPWHTHGDVLAAVSVGLPVSSFWSSCSPESAAESIAKNVEQFVADLLAGKLIIAVRRASGAIQDVWITDDLTNDLRFCPPEETIEFRRWDGSSV